jgi:hypothetical protein
VALVIALPLLLACFTAIASGSDSFTLALAGAFAFGAAELYLSVAWSRFERQRSVPVETAHEPGVV